MLGIRKFKKATLMASIALVGCSIHLFAEQNYLLGGDEDGCDTRRLQYCMCVPVKAEPLYCGHTQSSPVYCQGYEQIQMHCQLGDKRYENDTSQNDCLSETFQSIVSKLPIVSSEYCKQNHIAQCDSSGLHCHIE